MIILASQMQNNLTEGSVLKKLILFALPFLVSNVVQSLYNVADMLIVGNFTGSESMSGVNIGGQVTFILTNMVIGLCMGATVLISQYIGADKKEELRKVTSTILTLLPFIAAVLTVVVLIFHVPLLHLIETPPESFAEAQRYLIVTLIGLIFIFGYNALSAILRGMGDSKHPLYFVAIACVINIALDLLFVPVFGWGAFGAALATVISQAISMILCILFMVYNKFHFDFKFKSFKIDKEQLKLIFRIGTPTCIANSIVSLSFLFITTIVNTFGVHASAAVGAAGRFNSFAFMPVFAISASIGTMCAQNIGANRFDRAVKATRIGIVFSLFIMIVFFVLIQIFPAQIIHIFGDDPEVIAFGVEYFRSLSFDLLIVPFIFCLNGLFLGGGHTLFNMITNALSSVLLRVPICYFFGVMLEWGIMGVGMGAPVASFGTLLIMIIFLLSGRWKKNLVTKGIEA